MALTYREALQRLGRRVSVQIDKRRGTEIRRAPGEAGEAGEAGDIQVRYRGTPVVTFHSDNTYTLRTGGMATRTVRNRIAEYSPVSLAYRGGAYFLEDVNTGRLTPFLEGTRVDNRGQIVGGDGLSSGPQTAAAADLSPQQIDEAKLRAYILRAVQDVLQQRGAVPMPAPGVDGSPVRAVLRARARELPAQEPLITLPILERLLLDANVAPDKVRKILRDTRASFLRGRGVRVEADDDDAGAFIAAREREQAQEAETGPPYVPDETCETCGLNIVLHYDRANRPKGCAYAARHAHDMRLLS